MPGDYNIKLKVTDADAAARDLNKVAAAEKDVAAAAVDAGKGQDVMSEASARVRERLAEARAAIADAKGEATEGGDGFSSLFPTFEKAAAGAKGLGADLLAMAGGPMGVAAIAVGFLATKVFEHAAAMKEAKDAADAAGGSLRKKADATRDAGQAAEEATEKERHLAEAIAYGNDKAKEASGLAESRSKWTERAATAEDNLKKAILERQVAEGTITAADAAAMGLEIDKAAIDRRNAAAVGSAESQYAQAAQQAALARAAEAALEKQYAAAAGAPAGSAATQAERARSRQDKLKYQQSVLFKDGVSGGGIEAAFGGRDALNAALRGALPETGGNIVASAVAQGKGTGDLLQEFGMGEARRRLAEYLAQQAETAGKVAEKAEKDAEKEAAIKEKTLAELERQLDRVRKARETAEDNAAGAGRKRAEAYRQQGIDEDFTKPMLDEQQRVRALRENANQTPVPSEVLGSARAALNMADAGNQPMVALLQGLIGKLQNGTDSPELRAMISQLETVAANGVPLAAGDRARLASLTARLAKLEAQASNSRGGGE